MLGITQAHCLVLDKRIHEFPRIRDEWKNLGIKVDPFYCGDGITIPSYMYNHIDSLILPPILKDTIMYPTWLNRPNAFNAWLCHQKILTKFVETSHEKDNVLLLEDDSVVEPDFEEILEKAFVTDDLDSFDMLYLGCYNFAGSYYKTVNRHVIRLNGSGGFHGVVINHKVAKVLIEFPPIGPFDWIAGKLHNIYKSMAIYPCIVSQKDGIFSHVEGSVLNKPSRYNLGDK